jgi:glutathione synthase/RimK-type ligase-like ATP-grasp enzyme
VIWHAQRLGASTLRVSVDDVLSGECQITIEIVDGQPRWSIENRRAKYTDADEFAIFCRDYDVPNVSSQDHLGQCVLVEEVRALLNAFAALSMDRAWIDHPAVRERFDNKIYQVAIAGRYGFAIPSTLVTRSRDDVGRFLSGGTAVVKQISPFGIVALEAEETGIYTSPIVEIPPEGAIEACPTYFQRLVEKTSDIRVTAVDSVVFAHEILPLEGERHIVDFRQRRAEIIKPFEISDLTRSAIQKLMKAEGIRFACFDFGRVGETLAFFEANIAGNWLWLEAASAAPISHAVATAALSGTYYG